MTTPDHPRRRSAVTVPPGCLTFAMAAARLHISEETFRRRIRKVADSDEARLWAQRLGMTRRRRTGNLLDVYFVNEKRLAEWAHEIAPAGELVAPPTADPLTAANHDDPLD